jgi:hypothetical protein
MVGGALRPAPVLIPVERDTDLKGGRVVLVTGSKNQPPSQDQGF